MNLMICTIIINKNKYIITFFTIQPPLYSSIIFSTKEFIINTPHLIERLNHVFLIFLKIQSLFFFSFERAVEVKDFV